MVMLRPGKEDHPEVPDLRGRVTTGSMYKDEKVQELSFTGETSFGSVEDCYWATENSSSL